MLYQFCIYFNPSCSKFFIFLACANILFRYQIPDTRYVLLIRMAFHLLLLLLFVLLPSSSRWWLSIDLSCVGVVFFSVSSSSSLLNFVHIVSTPFHVHNANKMIVRYGDRSSDEYLLVQFYLFNFAHLPILIHFIHSLVHLLTHSHLLALLRAHFIQIYTVCSSFFFICFIAILLY